MSIRTEYLIDERGQKKSVVLSIRDYSRLMNYLEDLEDSLDIKKAKASARKYIDFNQFVTRLKKQRRLH